MTPRTRRRGAAGGRADARGSRPFVGSSGIGTEGDFAARPQRPGAAACRGGCAITTLVAARRDRLVEHLNDADAADPDRCGRGAWRFSGRPVKAGRNWALRRSRQAVHDGGEPAGTCSASSRMAPAVGSGPGPAACGSSSSSPNHWVRGSRARTRTRRASARSFNGDVAPPTKHPDSSGGVHQVSMTSLVIAGSGQERVLAPALPQQRSAPGLRPGGRRPRAGSGRCS